MAHPTLTVEVAFGDGPLETSPTWTDITEYVRYNPPPHIVRGRTSERNVYTAGTATFTLDNRDRRFDPTYLSGPYYGDLVPGVRVRIQATYSAVDYDMFTGWITGWPQTLSMNGKDSTVSIACVDGLAWLNRARVSDDQVLTLAQSYGSLELALRATDDYSWLDDEGTNHATLLFGRRAQSNSLGAGSSSPAVQFDGTTVWKLGTKVDSVPATYSDCTLSFWIRTSQRPDTSGYYTGAEIGIMGDAEKSTTGPSYYGAQFRINADGQFVWSYTTTLGFISYQTVQSVADGQPHHITLVRDGTAAAAAIYIDGEAATVVEDSSTLVLGAIGLEALGNASYQVDGTYTGNQFFNGSLQDVMLWSQALAPYQVWEFYEISRGFWSEAAADRLGRYLNDVDWPAGWRDISTTLRATCGQLVLNGRTGLECAQEVERTEQGYLFAAKDGDITLRSRYWHQEDTRGNTSQATFSDDGGAGSVKFSGQFGFKYNDQDIRNDILVTAEGVGRGRSTDLNSIAAYGHQGASLSTVLSTVQSAANMASGLGYKFGTPNWRSSQMVCYPARGNTWATVLGLELADRITQEITPMGVGSQIAKSMLVGRIEWVINEGDAWEFTVLGEPVPPSYFMLDSSSLDGPDYLGF